MEENLENLRKTYQRAALTESALEADPMDQFHLWFREALNTKGLEEPNTMAVSTVGGKGFPKNRMVLLKRYDKEGFVFYTNYESEKGKAIANDNKVCLSFYWQPLERQVIIKGLAEKSDPSDSDKYFQSRPKASQLGVLISRQSEVIPSRAALDAAMEELEKEYKDRLIPRPEYWGGYRVLPVSFEFWQGRPNRLHDRFRYRSGEKGQWIIERLSP